MKTYLESFTVALASEFVINFDVYLCFFHQLILNDLDQNIFQNMSANIFQNMSATYSTQGGDICPAMISKENKGFCPIHFAHPRN